jgi:hypothetical protein
MKKVTVVIIFAALSVISPLSFGAILKSMNKVQVEQAFINKTFTSIATDNLNGRTINNTNSVFLDDHGNILGKMAHKPANEPQTDKGVYSIKDDGTLYVTWQHWDGAKQLCFHMFDTKNAYIAIDCTDVFHSAFMKDAMQSGNHINA